MVFKRELEKQIAELIRENAVLKGRTEEFEKQILGLLYKYESVYKRFPDLKDAMDEAERVLKENAELETRCAELFLQNNEFAEQLTKAKEIIKNLLILKKDHHGNTDIEWRVEVTEQAEQFIKEQNNEA